MDRTLSQLALMKIRWRGQSEDSFLTPLPTHTHQPTHGLLPLLRGRARELYTPLSAPLPHFSEGKPGIYRNNVGLHVGFNLDLPFRRQERNSLGTWAWANLLTWMYGASSQQLMTRVSTYCKSSINIMYSTRNEAVRLLNPRPQLPAFTTHQVKHLKRQPARVARGNVWFWKKNADKSRIAAWGSCSPNSRLEPTWTQQVCKLAPVHIRNIWILGYLLGLKTGCKGLATDLELCGHNYKYTIPVTVTLLCQWGGPHLFPLLPPVVFFRETLALPMYAAQTDSIPTS